MAVVERHGSPDQALRLVVDRTDGDWIIGFEGQPWHTHGDMLNARGYDGPPEAMVREFVRDIILSRKEICVYSINGRIIDVNSYAEWAGEFDPEEFDTGKTTKAMRRGRLDWRQYE